MQVARPDTSVDIMLGTGGTPEGVITAAAMKCMGGTLQGRLAPRNDEEEKKALELGYDLSRILFVEDLCKGDQVALDHMPRTTPARCSSTSIIHLPLDHQHVSPHHTLGRSTAWTWT